MPEPTFMQLDNLQVFTNDPTDTPEYFKNINSQESQPEKKLMFAILKDAIECLKEPTKQEAEKWIMSEDKRWIFSFRNICEELGLDPDYLRRGLRQFLEKAA